MYVYSTFVLDSASLLHEYVGVGVTDKVIGDSQWSLSLL